MTRCLSCLLVVGLLGGCGGKDNEGDGGNSRCESFCQESNSCDGDMPEPGQCGYSCAAVDDVNRSSGCADEFEAILSCVDGIDVCDSNQAAMCDTQASNWLDCFEAYCTAHPEDTNC